MSSVPRNLSAMSYGDLSKLEQQIAALKNKQFEAAQAKIAEKGNELSAKLAKFARDLGIPPQNVPTITVAHNGNGHGAPRKGKTPRTQAAKKPSTVAVKYRDPANPTNTWTGRGMTPRWITKSGKQKEAFLIAS